VSQFIGSEDAIVCNMGYATNVMHIPALMSGRGTLILSDALNHTSLVFGVRLALGATVRVFRHCDLQHLALLLREGIAQGQPKGHRPWRRIVVLVEGLYSMEGTLPYLPGLLALKKKYKFYLWIDEAHSIGAIGRTGRGIGEHFGLTTAQRAEVDLWMGTFTKSFGAAGGYVAGSRRLIQHLRATGHAAYASEGTAPPVLAMIRTALLVLMRRHPAIQDGPLRLAQLHANASAFRAALKARGFAVLGDDASPVVPLLIFQPAKMAAFSRACLAHGLAVVVVAYPATPMNLARVRFCLSANHSPQDLARIINLIDSLGDALQIKYHQHLIPLQ
jgi:serine palmitoyltransferase